MKFNILSLTPKESLGKFDFISDEGIVLEYSKISK